MADPKTPVSEDERLRRLKEQELGRARDPSSRLDAKKGLAHAAFATRTETEKWKKQQLFDARFRTPRVREAAIEVEEDAREQKEDIERDTNDKIEALYKGLDLTRPVPPEYALYMNAKIVEYLAQRRSVIDEIDTDLTEALSQIEAVQHEIDRIGPLDESRQITYQPDYRRDFNHASTGPALDL